MLSETKNGLYWDSMLHELCKEQNILNTKRFKPKHRQRIYQTHGHYALFQTGEYWFETTQSLFLK